MEKGSVALQRTNGSAHSVALSVDTHQLWHSSSGVEIKFEYVSGHLPANCFTEEIEIKDRVWAMLFKLKSVLYPPDAGLAGNDSDKLEKINNLILSGCCQ